ncbi:MAG: lysostaphin resistance A-like protein [Promethearchaeota archaeon]
MRKDKEGIMKTGSIGTNRILIVLSIVIIPYVLFGMDFLGWLSKIFTGIDITPTTFIYIVFTWIITFISLFLIPFLLYTRYWKANLKQIGTSWGNRKLGMILLIIGLIIVVPLMYIGSSDLELMTTYPLARDVINTPHIFIIYEVLYGLLYYIPYEFFFRGFLQLGLSKKWGEWKAIIFVTIVTALIHLSKPISELISAAAVGILFGYIAYKTDSWYYIFIIHYSVGVLTDIFCALRFIGII